MSQPVPSRWLISICDISRTPALLIGSTVSTAAPAFRRFRPFYFSAVSPHFPNFERRTGRRFLKIVSLSSTGTVAERRVLGALMTYIFVPTVRLPTSGSVYGLATPREFVRILGFGSIRARDPELSGFSELGRRSVVCFRVLWWHKSRHIRFLAILGRFRKICLLLLLRFFQKFLFLFLATYLFIFTSKCTLISVAVANRNFPYLDGS